MEADDQGAAVAQAARHPLESEARELRVEIGEGEVAAEDEVELPRRQLGHEILTFELHALAERLAQPMELPALLERRLAPARREVLEAACAVARGACTLKQRRT